MQPVEEKREPLLVAEAGVSYRVAPNDPIAAWFDLMEMVASLRPEQPRLQPKIWRDYRL